MALPHTPSSEVVRILPLGAALPDAVTSAILKASELEIIRVVVPAGKTLPQHQVPGEITLLCIEGEVQLVTPGNMQALHPHDFVHLEGGTPHALTGITDASLLLTISLAASLSSGQSASPSACLTASPTASPSASLSGGPSANSMP